MTDPLSKTGDRSKDLCIGEPEFLQRWTRRAKLLGYEQTAEEGEGVAYPGYPPFKGNPLLLKRIAKYAGTDYRHYVVTVGAKQGLYASIYAMKRNKPRAAVLAHSRPYWPTYPTIAQNMGLFFEPSRARAMTPSGAAFIGLPSEGTLPGEITIQTTPNNPDGAQLSPFDHDVDIWDGAYAHAVYGWNGNAPQHQIGVFSASKLLGLSDMRVGWVGTDDDGIAHDVAAYVEAHTSGVSVADQLYAADVLTQVGSADHLGCRDTILRNVDSFNKYIAPFVTDDIHGAPGPEECGMFAWFKPKNWQDFTAALEETGVKLLDGGHCGHGDYYRMNLGRETLRTWPLLARIEKVLR